MRVLLILGMGLLVAVIGFSLISTDSGNFSFVEDDLTVTVLDDDLPVLSIVHGRAEAPEGINADFWRSNYVHPVFGLDGEQLTEDFPADHPHHRGVFWTWPEVTYGEKELDPWALDGARQLFGQWLEREAKSDRAVVSFQSGWHLQGSEDPFVAEEISITVHPADEMGRPIDFHLRFQNVSDETVTLRGRGETGYGGFNVRPDGSRPGNRITTATGELEEDALIVESGWADYSFEVDDEGTTAGLALFQHPANPGFPHPGWILRHYGFLGASWPQYDELRLSPGEEFTLRYRLVVHRGDAQSANVADRFETFVPETTSSENQH